MEAKIKIKTIGFPPEVGSPNTGGPVSPLPPKSRVCYAAEFQPAEMISRKLTTQMNLKAISAIISLKTITQRFGTSNNATKFKLYNYELGVVGCFP